MRGYGTLQSMAATEMMVDEVADRLGVDAIELRRKNALRSGMKNTQGAIPAGALRLHEILDKAAVHEVWKNRDAIKQQREAADPDNWYGVGFAICQKDFGTGSEAPMASIEFTADGRITPAPHRYRDRYRHVDLAGHGRRADFLGSPAHEVKTGETDWKELQLISSGNPYIMSQAEQDNVLPQPALGRQGRLRRRRATNSAYYFSHATREAARVLFNHGLWPAALEIWRQGPLRRSGQPLRGAPRRRPLGRRQAHRQRHGAACRSPYWPSVPTSAAW